MKKYIFIILPIFIATVFMTVAFLFLTSLDSVNSSATTTSLTPLNTVVITNPTSTVPLLEDLPVGVSQDQLGVYFVSKTKEIFGSSFTAYSDDELLDIGYTWCYVILGGMKAADVEARINEGASDNDDAAVHRAIISAAMVYLCPQAKL